MSGTASPSGPTSTPLIWSFEMFNRKVDSTVLHSEQEVVGSFKPGDNKFRIEVTGGTGTLVISDIVLHYVRFS